MKTIKVDVVDFWNGFDKTNWWVINLLRKHYNVVFSDKPDFVFFSCFSNNFLKYNNSVRIFFTGENVIPNFNYCDYATGFAYMDFGDRYFRRYNTSIPESVQNRDFVTDDLVNRRFCNFIYSNDIPGVCTQMRQDFCKKLMEYKNVDCPGKVLHNMDTDELEPRDGNWINSKKEFLKKYKFTIAFENAVSDGYTTEKLFHPVESYSVPIYYGNPLVVRDFNPKSFINCNDYDNDFDKIIERIKYLDTHDDEYLAMLREKPMQPDFDFGRDSKFEKWLCDIIESGKVFDKGMRNGWEISPFKKRIVEEKARNEQLEQKIIQNYVSEKSLVKLQQAQTDICNKISLLESKVKSNHKKQRKYFNVLFVCCIVLLILLIIK